MTREILEHFEQYKCYLEFNYRIYKIMQGQLKEEVECSLKKEITSPSAYLRAAERIPSINVLRKGTDKLSKVYIEKPVRRVDNQSDQDIFQEIQRISAVDNSMMLANKYYNAAHAFAIEPYIHDRKQKFRVLAPHQFLPFSDDLSDPTNMTVFIKILGNETEYVGPEYDEDGDKVNDRQTRDILILGLYSDTEFLIIDSGGKIRNDKMAAMGLTDTRHDFGRIPFLYKSKTQSELIAFPNQEGFDMSVLIPKLLTDLNYACQFLSKSIIWTKNAKIEGQELNPDNVVDLGDRTEENGDPEIGTIDPKVDIPNQLNLIEFQINSYFSSIGIKTDAKIQSGEEASGVAKAIDEGDTTAEKKVQTEFFRCVEQELWDLMEGVQNLWARKNLVDENRTLSTEFAETFRIRFSEMRPAKTERQKLDDIKLWMDIRLMTRKQALRELRPDFTDKQIDEWVKDLEEEQESDMEKALDFSPAPDNGQFKGENEKAKNDPTKRLEAEEKKISE